MKISKIVLILVALLIISGGLWFFTNSNEDINDNQVACTAEAKLCSDGSFVGRTGSSCEFAECPAEVSSPEDTPDEEILPLIWNTHTNTEWRYSLKYPSDYTLTEELDGTKIIISPSEEIEKNTDFLSVRVIQYPEVNSIEELPKSLFYQANLPDGKLTWLKDPKLYDSVNHILEWNEITFGASNYKALDVEEKSIRNSLGIYRSVVYVLRDPVIYRITHDLLSETTHGDIIKRIEDSFMVLE